MVQEKNGNCLLAFHWPAAVSIKLSAIGTVYCSGSRTPRRIRGFDNMIYCSLVMLYPQVDLRRLVVPYGRVCTRTSTRTVISYKGTAKSTIFFNFRRLAINGKMDHLPITALKSYCRIEHHAELDSYQKITISTNNNQYSETTMTEDAANAATPAMLAMRGGVEYRCGDCGAINVIKASDPVRCRQCGFRILYKMRTKRCMCPWISSSGWLFDNKRHLTLICFSNLQWSNLRLDKRDSGGLSVSENETVSCMDKLWRHDIDWGIFRLALSTNKGIKAWAISCYKKRSIAARQYIHRLTGRHLLVVIEYFKLSFFESVYWITYKI